MRGLRLLTPLLAGGSLEAGWSGYTITTGGHHRLHTLKGPPESDSPQGGFLRRGGLKRPTKAGRAVAASCLRDAFEPRHKESTRGEPHVMSGGGPWPCPEAGLWIAKVIDWGQVPD